jgi:DNA (cytosine-5)-methyltransferase 1
MAVDTSEAARRVYALNYPEADVRRVDINEILPGAPGEKTASEERRLVAQVGAPDLVLGGPPCQGHSDLNNHTRRSDPKNVSFMKMARCAEVLSPTHIVVENVNGVLHDAGDIFARTSDYLDRLGYEIDWGILKGEVLGVPQTRHRVFLVASKSKKPNLEELSRRFATTPRSADWAVSDLLFARGEGAFDEPSVPAPISRRRIDYLFDNSLYDLPDSERPPCHRLKEHSYVSVYGRIRPHEPAPTITTGFTSMGQGRFVHPYRRRTITPHEAARIQFFPDFFRFGDLSRSEYRTLIGNAVPAKFTYLVCLDLLG